MMDGSLRIFIGIVCCSMIGIGIGLSITEHNKTRYERWEELGPFEIDLVRECVRQQPYADCLENVYQMRQIGIAP